MLLSFIVPVYNGDKYLEDSLNSILSQPADDYEIICMDDGSTDRSSMIIDNYERNNANFHAIHIKNQGVANARNVGIEHAKGQYIAFLDADDHLCKAAYDNELKEILESQRFDIIGFGYIYGNDNIRKGRYERRKGGVYAREDQGYNREVINRHPCSLIYKKELIGNIRFPKGIRYAEDTTFQFLVTRAAKTLLIIDKYWFIYRNNISSALHSYKVDHIFTDTIPAWHWCRDKCKNKKDYYDCEGMIFSLAMEYVKNAAAFRINVDEIFSQIDKCTELKSVIPDIDLFWKTNDAMHIYEALNDNPLEEYKRLRKTGYIKYCMFRMARTPGIRQIYLNLKYREDIRKYL